jgi:hypothetical protein
MKNKILFILRSLFFDDLNSKVYFILKDFPTSRLELEAVADIFDLDKDGYIDYKEFLATLKPTAVIFHLKI